MMAHLSGEGSGDLHGNHQRRRRVGEMFVTEGTYLPGKQIGWHDHEFASFCVVLAGGYDERFDHHSRRAEPGTLIIHPAGEHHQEVHDPVPAKLLTVEMDGGFLSEFGREVSVLDEPWHRVDFAAAAWAYRICFEISRDDAASDLVIESAILGALGEMQAIQSAGSCQAAWLSRVRDRLHAESDVTPTMQELAGLADVHPVHLARTFRRRFGCSIGAYVRRLQVGKAALLIEGGALPLSLIAAEAGFSDQSHMTRLVANHTGMTPGAWRRRGAAS